MSLLAALCLALFAAWYLISPLFTESAGAAENPRALLEERERYAEMLAGLELDLAMGKISADQFALAKKELLKAPHV